MTYIPKTSRGPVAAFIGIAAGFAFLGGLFLGLAPANADSAEGAATAKVGQAAPDFKLMDQDGKPVSLSDYKGKVVVLEQFNDQCPYVKKWYKNGDMSKLAKAYEAKGVVWLAVDSSNFTTVAENKAIAQEWKMDRPVLDDHGGTVGKLYGMKTTPDMRVIDKDGTLVYSGGIDSIASTETGDIAKATNYVAKALDEVLAGETVTTPQAKSYGCSVKY